MLHQDCLWWLCSCRCCSHSTRCKVSRVTHVPRIRVSLWFSRREIGVVGPNHDKQTSDRKSKSRPQQILKLHHFILVCPCGWSPDKLRHEGWNHDEESGYLDAFWNVVSSFSESEKVQFVVFVTASDRVPLRGWQEH